MAVVKYRRTNIFSAIRVSRRWGGLIRSYGLSRQRSGRRLGGAVGASYFFMNSSLVGIAAISRYPRGGVNLFHGGISPRPAVCGDFFTDVTQPPLPCRGTTPHLRHARAASTLGGGCHVFAHAATARQLLRVSAVLTEQPHHLIGVRPVVSRYLALKWGGGIERRPRACGILFDACAGIFGSPLATTRRVLPTLTGRPHPQLARLAQRGDFFLARHSAPVRWERGVHGWISAGRGGACCFSSGLTWGSFLGLRSATVPGSAHASSQAVAATTQISWQLRHPRTYFAAVNPRSARSAGYAAALPREEGCYAVGAYFISQGLLLTRYSNKKLQFALPLPRRAWLIRRVVTHYLRNAVDSLDLTLYLCYYVLLLIAWRRTWRRLRRWNAYRRLFWTATPLPAWVLAQPRKRRYGWYHRYRLWRIAVIRELARAAACPPQLRYAAAAAPWAGDVLLWLFAGIFLRAVWGGRRYPAYSRNTAPLRGLTRWQLLQTLRPLLRGQSLLWLIPATTAAFHKIGGEFTALRRMAAARQHLFTFMPKRGAAVLLGVTGPRGGELVRATRAALGSFVVSARFPRHGGSGTGWLGAKPRCFRHYGSLTLKNSWGIQPYVSSCRWAARPVMPGVAWAVVVRCDYAQWRHAVVSGLLMGLPTLRDASLLARPLFDPRTLPRRRQVLTAPTLHRPTPAATFPRITYDVINLGSVDLTLRRFQPKSAAQAPLYARWLHWLYGRSGLVDGGATTVAALSRLRIGGPVASTRPQRATPRG